MVAELSGSVVLVDDVLTSGKALREAVALVADSDATISGVVIALDRQERFSDADKTAVMQLQEDLQVPVISIAKMDDIVEFLGNSDAADSELLLAMQNYRREYCL